MVRFWKFTCTRELEEECLQKKLVGAPSRLWKEVKEIKKGDIIFLHNIDTDTLHGPFYAETEGIMNIDPYALGRKNPSQVKVEWKNISKITEASKKFSFLERKGLSLEESEGKAILDMMETK
ncbi:MAG: hypothetical protein ABDH32_01300 [Candidatus Caldarchaeales archaeon]